MWIFKNYETNTQDIDIFNYKFFNEKKKIYILFQFNENAFRRLLILISLLLLIDTNYIIFCESKIKFALKANHYLIFLDFLSLIDLFFIK